MQDLISGIVKIKVGMVRGVYITGSIPLNDFQPGKSDIDFVILCDEPPPEQLQKRLEKLHNKIERRYKTKLGGSFIDYSCLDILHAEKKHILTFHEGRMLVKPFEMAPVTLFELKTTAIRMGGIEIESLPIQISLNELHIFLNKNMNSYWKKWCDQHATIFHSKLLLILFPRLTEWVILGIARQLYTLLTGRICSKTEAGYYALKHLPEKHHPVIHEAIHIREQNRKHIMTLHGSYYIHPSISRCNQTLSCAYSMIDFFNEEFNKISQNGSCK